MAASKDWPVKFKVKYFTGNAIFAEKCPQVLGNIIPIRITWRDLMPTHPQPLSSRREG